MTVLRRFGLLAPLAALSLAGCGLNSVPTAEENVNAKWGDLQADYQRRSDLIPNLVETVKGYAQQEKTVLVEVTNARANAGRVQLNPSDLSDPAKVQAFNDAQNRLTQAIIPLQRLQEAYPDLPGRDRRQDLLRREAEGAVPGGRRRGTGAVGRLQRELK
jgi:LemA protein